MLDFFGIGRNYCYLNFLSQVLDLLDMKNSSIMDLENKYLTLFRIKHCFLDSSHQFALTFSADWPYASRVLTFYLICNFSSLDSEIPYLKLSFLY